jgi:hypothetical protein
MNLNQPNKIDLRAKEKASLLLSHAKFLFSSLDTGIGCGNPWNC